MVVTHLTWVAGVGSSIPGRFVFFFFSTLLAKEFVLLQTRVMEEVSMGLLAKAWRDCAMTRL